MIKSTPFFHTPPSESYQMNGSPSGNRNRTKVVLLKLLSLLVFFGLLIFVSLYFLSPYSNIETLSVEGTNDVLDQQVIDSSGVRSGDPLWVTYFEREEIEQRVITLLPQVSDAILAFSGINDFTFEIKEYNTVAYLLENNGYLKVLENGIIVEDDYSTSIGNQPVFINFKEGNALDRMINQFDEMDVTIQNLISEVELVENERNSLLVRVYMNNGNQVLASIPSFAERMSLYPQMVEAVDGKYGIFDLEAGAFFVPFLNNDPESNELEENSEIELENIED